MNQEISESILHPDNDAWIGNIVDIVNNIERVKSSDKIYMYMIISVNNMTSVQSTHSVHYAHSACQEKSTGPEKITNKDMNTLTHCQYGGF